MSNSRVPDTIEEFNTYIGNTDDYNLAGTPTTNALRLGLTTDNVAAWTQRRTDWAILYPKYTNPATSTSIIKGDVRSFMKEFKEFAMPLLNVIAASPAINSTDAATYHVVPDNAHQDPTHPTTPIAAVVMAIAKPIGGGDLDFTCRTSTDSSHASIPEHADSVQLAYVIGTTPPANLTEAPLKEISTKAKFIMHAGAENSGKKLYGYIRWYNVKHPNLAGPWSDMITVSIN